MLKHLECTNFRTLESGHVFHANLNRKHLIHFQKGMKGNKCNERLLSPTGSHGSIAGSRAIRQWEKRDTEWEVLDLLHGITSERKPELRQCDVWELKPRHRSGECWANFSSMFQPPYFSSPQPKFDDLGTNLPLSIRPEVDTRPKPNNRDSVKEVEKGTESRDSQWRSYKPKSILEIIFC